MKINYNISYISYTINLSYICNLKPKKIKFSTKSKNLLNLKGKLKNAEVLDQLVINFKQFKKDSSIISKSIKRKKWDNISLIARSSSISEDQDKSSKAGMFLTVSDIKGIDEINSAVEKIFRSYHHACYKDEVFIQPFLKKVKSSGVIFTRDINNNTPYIKINYDDSGGRCDAITSGTGKNNKLFFYHKLHKKKVKGTLGRLINLSIELEQIFQNDSIDIEYVITNSGKLYLTQVRPLFINYPKIISDNEHYDILLNIHRRAKSWFKRQPYLFGEKAIYGVMPDWNPAEIIGSKPRPLSISLYRELVTNSIWAYQRDNYGYKNLRSFPLLVEFEGIPYIDARVSFNSFIPKNLDDKIAEKLVNYYLNKLKKNPGLHDKIEFDIIYSCFTLDTEKKLRILENFDFSKSEINEIKKSLLSLTNNIINIKNGLWKNDIEKINQLEEKYKIIMDSSIDNYAKIYWLIEDCKRYGTLPFAGLARAGFIAVELLKSCVNQNVINRNEYSLFLESLNTVSGSLLCDIEQLTKKQFLKKYGHLRPGTYDILSKSYNEYYDSYFKFKKRKSKKVLKKSFNFSTRSLEKLDELLKNTKLDINANELLVFIKTAIEAREYSKFIFSKNINSILNIYKEIAKSLTISEDDSSYTHIGSIMSLNSIISDPKKIINASIQRRKKRFNYTKLINLPNLISNLNDIFYYHENESKPNFITQKSVLADVIVIDNIKNNNIKNKIVMIENADPGYDWIFSHKISGLITKYGGSNSHMAIRSAELGIPAAIGTGLLYDKLLNAKKIKIDTFDEKIIIIN